MNDQQQQPGYQMHHGAAPAGFDPYAPVGSGAPTYAPPGYVPPSADLPVHGHELAPATEGSSASVDPSRPCSLTAGDLFMTMNGFDEIAVATRFGATITELRADAVTLGRALAFVDMRRKAQGQPGADESAYQGAMSLTIDQITNGYFQPEPKGAPEAAPSGEAPGVS